MPILDLHSVYDSTGSTDTIVVENNANAVIPAGDGATTIGLSPFNGAILLAYGAHVAAAAQAVVTIGLQSNNLVDPVNGLLDTATGTDTRVLASKFATMGYTKGPNRVQYGQEAAGALLTFKLDLVGVGSSSAPVNLALQNVAEYTFSAAAATAGVYKSTAFNPTTTPPIGKYRILGLRGSAITMAAAVRFQHTDFAGAFPGFPLLSFSDAALTPANQGGNTVFSDPSYQGYQFVALSQFLGTPLCPEFSIQGQSTGLTVQVIDCTTDTVTFDLVLQKIA